MKVLLTLVQFTLILAIISAQDFNEKTARPSRNLQKNQDNEENNKAYIKYKRKNLIKIKKKRNYQSTPEPDYMDHSEEYESEDHNLPEIQDVIQNVEGKNKHNSLYDSPREKIVEVAKVPLIYERHFEGNEKTQPKSSFVAHQYSYNPPDESSSDDSMHLEKYLSNNVIQNLQHPETSLGLPHEISYPENYHKNIEKVPVKVVPFNNFQHILEQKYQQEPVKQPTSFNSYSGHSFLTEKPSIKYVKVPVQEVKMDDVYSNENVETTYLNPLSHHSQQYTKVPVYMKVKNKYRRPVRIEQSEIITKPKSNIMNLLPQKLKLPDVHQIHYLDDNLDLQRPQALHIVDAPNLAELKYQGSNNQEYNNYHDAVTLQKIPQVYYESSSFKDFNRPKTKLNQIKYSLNDDIITKAEPVYENWHNFGKVEHWEKPMFIYSMYKNDKNNKKPVIPQILENHIQSVINRGYKKPKTVHTVTEPPQYFGKINIVPQKEQEDFSSTETFTQSPPEYTIKNQFKDISSYKIPSDDNDKDIYKESYQLRKLKYANSNEDFSPFKYNDFTSHSNFNEQPFKEQRDLGNKYHQNNEFIPVKEEVKDIPMQLPPSISAEQNSLYQNIPYLEEGPKYRPLTFYKEPTIRYKPPHYFRPPAPVYRKNNIRLIYPKNFEHYPNFKHRADSPKKRGFLIIVNDNYLNS